MIPFIHTTNGLSIIFSDGENITIDKNHAKYNDVVQALELPEDDLRDILNKSLAQEAGLDVSELNPVLANIVERAEAEGAPMGGLVKFCENLNLNPSSASVEELYDFLRHENLPITEDGCFLAYKGILLNGYSKHGNTKTKVLKGDVDNQGRIRNTVGDTIEVARNQVNDNRDVGCSYGLHVGSKSYASSWAPKLMLVKVNPKDVVSVPNDCSHQKCRVCKYEVVKIYENEQYGSVANSDGSQKTFDNKYQNFLDQVDEFLEDNWQLFGSQLLESLKLEFPNYNENQLRIAVNDLNATNALDE